MGVVEILGLFSVGWGISLGYGGCMFELEAT